MHRHGYNGRKFGRETDQRLALIKSLAESLITYETIETTLPKAKAVVPYVERLITKAKKGGLANRRLVIQDLQTVSSAHKLFDEIAPKLKDRDSGFLRIKRTSFRRGDNTQLARISFVDDLTAAPVAKAVEKTEPAAKSTAKKAPATAAKTAVKKKLVTKKDAK